MLLALALVASVPGPSLGQAPATPAPDCATIFDAADAILDAVAATDTDATPELRAALLDLTIAGCASRTDWLTTAPEHPGLLDGSAPSASLSERCAASVSGLSGSPACAPIRLVARPDVVPKVKGAQRTRTYPIVGLSPDQLFTQMQLNGSAHCPTHALACTLVQPRIPDEQRERIFEVFTRLPGTDVEQGTGIGLAIVRKAARTVGSDVIVESEVGAGTSFSILLPCSDPSRPDC